MRFCIAHFAIWIFAVPWVASSLWLWLDAEMRAPAKDLIGITGSLAVAMVCGLLGVMQNLLITLPLASAAWLLITLRPVWLLRCGLWVGFTAATSITGFAWAACCARSLNTGRVEYALLVIGAMAGLALGVLTMCLWKGHKPKAA